MASDCSSGASLKLLLQIMDMNQLGLKHGPKVRETDVLQDPSEMSLADSYTMDWLVGPESPVLQGRWAV